MRSWVAEAMDALRGALAGDLPPLEFLPSAHGSPRWAERTDISQVPVGQDCGQGPSPRRPARTPATTAERPTVVVRTSGSTGTPKQTVLTTENLRASAEATAEALGGHGQWLLTLQPSYVAGLAVLSRSLFAGTTPVALLEHTTDPAAFTHAAEQLTAERRYVSLVPTQLQRLLDSCTPAPTTPARQRAPTTGTSLDAGQPEGPVPSGAAGATEPERQEHTTQTQSEKLIRTLRRFDAILLGGGPSSPALIARAEALRLKVIRTYGMSETAGGCVYDGRPLTGVRVSILPNTDPGSGDSPHPEAGVGSERWQKPRIGTPEHGAGRGTRTEDAAQPEGSSGRQAGRVALSGPMIAAGYLDPELSASRFDLDPTTGERRFLTDDLGELAPAQQYAPHESQPFTGTTEPPEACPEARHLRITGRADDVIITGGVKVSAEKVRQTLEADPRVDEAFVTGVPDPEWGQSVAAVIVPEGTLDGQLAPIPATETHTLLAHLPREQLKAAVREQLGPAAVPKRMSLLGSLPRLPNGKPDRQRLTQMLHSADVDSF